MFMHSSFKKKQFLHWGKYSMYYTVLVYINKYLKTRLDKL